MTSVARNFNYLIGEVAGLSEKQFLSHFELYKGYVKKVNEIEEALKSANRATANYSYGEVSELHRRRTVAYNGAYLHQLYFENLIGKNSVPGAELKSAIERDFGSIESLLVDLKACLMSAHGWALLTRSRIDGVLRCDLVEEHHRGVMVEQDILLALDGWEHAYMIDYGINKGEYVRLLEKAIHWSVVADRFSASKAQTRIAA